MTAPAPVVYLLYGEDEYAIAHFLAELEAKMGDATLAALNTTRLDGRSYNLEELPSIANALPFLARRRLVVLSYPLALASQPQERNRFLDMMEKIPPSTALALVEYRQLTPEKERKAGRINWLEAWADAHPGYVLKRYFPRPRGKAMAGRIQEMAKAAGGRFTQAAAEQLAELVGDEPRLADQEIQKLLAYVNYQRAVEPDDVARLTADVAPGDIFILVDALGNQDGRGAIRMLQRLLESDDPLSIFGMIVRQFRLLLLAREVIELKGSLEDFIRQTGTNPFAAKKVFVQAQRFDLLQLDQVYRRLLEIDVAMKTGQMEGELALETLVVETGGKDRITSQE